MAGEKRPKVAHTAAELRFEESEKAVAVRTEQLRERNRGFLRLIPTLIARYAEHEARVKAENPFTPTGSTGPWSGKAPDAFAQIWGGVFGAAAAAEGGGKEAKKRKRAEPPAAAGPRPRYDHAADAGGNGIDDGRDLPPLPDDSRLRGELRVLRYEAEHLLLHLQRLGTWLLLTTPAKNGANNSFVEEQETMTATTQKYADNIADVVRRESEFLESKTSLESDYYRYHFSSGALKRVENLDITTWNETERCWALLASVLYAIL
ncbi:hypothetical protein DIPPA_25778 [Diplonema papillatum]|nr:hypothetical protein DIPPA_25778 [Diplonema papillatum]